MIFRKLSLLPSEILEIASYYITNKSTVRDTAKHFSMSKSRIHTILTRDLINLKHNPNIAQIPGYYSICDIVRSQLKSNFMTKHLKGGMATKRKYENMSKD